jgi:DNA (cytosine-5)-methyltransferase 1
MSRPKLLDLFCGAGGCAMGYHRAGFDIVGVDIEPQPRYPFEFHQANAFSFLDWLHEAEYDHVDNAVTAFNCAGAHMQSDFSVIHASPPCQGYSRMRHLPWLKGKTYPMLIQKTRELLEKSGKPYVIENVEDAARDMGYSIMLCGTMFGLKVYRHRLFMSNQWLWQPDHPKHTEIIGSGRMLNDRVKGNDSGFVSLPSKHKLFAGRNGSSDSTDQVSNRNYHSDGSVAMSVSEHNFKVSAASIAMGIDWMKRDELAQAIPPAYTEYIGKQLIRLI